MKRPYDMLDSTFEWCFKNHPNARAKMYPIYRKNRELACYGIFGIGTFLISIFTYALLTENFSWNILVSNALSWVFATAFAFVTNRRYVFVSHAKGLKAFLLQAWSFSAGRLFTLAIEEWMLYFFIGKLDLPNMPVKFCSQFIVIALNYLFSKLIVFRKHKEVVKISNRKDRDKGMISFNDARDILESKGQLQVLNFYDELSDLDKKMLLKQVSELNFKEIAAAQNPTTQEQGEVKPLPAMSIDEIEKNKDTYKETGLKNLKEGKLACVLLAGGMGTRLGLDKPKGELNFGVTHEHFLFQKLVENLLEVKKEANGASIPLYIMTSEKNDLETKQFFETHNYFGYPKEDVGFFVQEMAAAVDYDGKLYLESKGRIATSPNGNGGWFSSMKKAGLLDDAKRRGIEWINIFSVDNPLQKMADPVFLGATIESGSDSGAKVVRKAYPEEKMGVMCLQNNQPSVIEYYELTDEMANLRDDNGILVYGFGVILNYVFKLDKLEEIVETILPVHVVEKKIPYVDMEGKLHKPEEPNGYKFETLVVDMVRLMNNCLPFEVIREEEFAPIKNLHGKDSLDTARELLEKNGFVL